MKFCYIAYPKIAGAKFSISAKGKYWKTGETIDVFLIGGTTIQRGFAIKAMLEYEKHCNLKFRLTESAKDTDVRISFVQGGGAWSYVGTDALTIPESQPTMNIGWEGMSVALHEVGHAVGLLHEHQHPESGIDWDEAQVIADLSAPPNSWSIDVIKFNVLEAVNPANVDTSDYDEQSIMHYFFPTHWSKNGKGVGHLNNDLSEGDIEYLSELYPFPQQPIDCTESTIEFINELYTSKYQLNRLTKKQLILLSVKFELPTKGLLRRELIQELQTKLF